ncbi:TlpA disulfide reductase family protein [Segetibacter koreensis]|uniref:TlpA disulfide reductase family protein n=1 Tax=Segetibacter koreensis TaxID=398037 RepID=UPI000360D5F6|nr:TlpA disulfide reductase family protein [Segetibacter koreensis]
MKKLLPLLLFPFFSIAQNVNDSTIKGDFSITGNIKGLPDSTMVFLARPGQPSDVLATTYAQKGKFNLFGKVVDGDIYQLNFIGFPDQPDVFLTPAKINVTGDVKTLKKLVFTGSTAQNDYQSYTLKFNALKDRLANLAGVINKTPESRKRDSLINIFEKNKQKVLEQVDLFVKAKPASPVTPFIIYVTSPVDNNVNGLENRYSALLPAAKETFYGREIAKLLASSKIGMEGTQAIDFTQNDTANNPVSLSSFKGKYVLVDFWASWCGPCRHENPAVVAAYNQYKDKNFTILSVSLDQNKDKWKQAILADNLTWTHVSDLKYWQNEVAQLYHIQSIPANMLIDPSGKIIARDLRGEALSETLGKLLNK